MLSSNSQGKTSYLEHGLDGTVGEPHRKREIVCYNKKKVRISIFSLLCWYLSEDIVFFLLFSVNRGGPLTADVILASFLFVEIDSGLALEGIDLVRRSRSSSKCVNFEFLQRFCGDQRQPECGGSAKAQISSRRVCWPGSEKSACV